MARCYFSGVEIDIKEAFVLDLPVARRALRELKEKVATLERLIVQLGRTDVVRIPGRGSSSNYLRKDRRVVSRTMASALGAVCPDRELFVLWEVWRLRGRTIWLTGLYDHPDYGARLRELSDTDRERVLALAREVLRRLGLRRHLPDDVWIAVRAGVCVTLRERSAEEIVALLQHRAQVEEPLQDLGVPVQIEAQFRDALRGRQTEPQQCPEIYDDAPSVNLAQIASRRETK